MGSNDNRHGDRRYGSEWGSKARKHLTNSKRRLLEEKSIEDSQSSHHVTPQELMPDHGLGPPLKKKKKRGASKWCRRKEGQEHDYVLFKQHRSAWWYWFDEYKCSRCGKKKTIS